MYAAYGAYQHATDEVAITDYRKQRNYNRRGNKQSVIHTMTLQGTLIPSSADPTTITSEFATLQNAYARDGLNFGLYENDGTPTDYFLNSGTALGGVKVVQAPSLPDGQGASYVTHLRYSIQLQAEYVDALANLEFYQEKITFVGTAGPVRQWVTPISGPPQRQIISQRSTQRITQSGQAMGYMSEVPAGTPLWPEIEHVDRRRIGKDSPTVNGLALTGFLTTWAYEFESATNLSGIGPRAQ